MKHLSRISLFMAVCLLLAVGTASVLAAEPPSITVAPVWNPPLQLTSAETDGMAGFPTSDEDECYEPGYLACGDGKGPSVDDDVRYATAEIWVTSTVQFWAVQMTCTVNKALLEDYAWDHDAPWSDDWNDNRPMVEIGQVWNEFGGHHAIVDNYNPLTGSITFTATRMGAGNPPLGGNGTSKTQMLASIQYRVKQQAQTFTTGTSPFTCTSTFLDRDGKPVIAPKFVAPTPLTIRNGYTITGNVKYQARANHANIGVQCFSDSGFTPDRVMTNAAGNFTVNTRRQGWYECLMYGNIVDANPNEQSDIVLRTLVGASLYDVQSYTMLPVVMPNGNVDISSPAAINLDCDPGAPGDQPCADEFIDILDINVITNNWNTTGTTALAGDANGDGKTDKSDLAIVGSNMGWGEDLWVEHVLYSLPRNYDQFQNSKVWLGDQNSGMVTPLVNPKATSRDLWATLSPDGKQIAFIRSETVRNSPDRYALWLVNADGKTGLKRLTPLSNKWAYDAFAPSWSPTGTQLAFVCSWSGGYQNDEGFLCTIDTNGRNLRIMDDTRTHIFPPTWNWQEIWYGGTSNDWVCPNSICRLYSLADQGRTILDYSFNTSSTDIPTGADMPKLVDGNLIYRYTSGGSRSLRFAQVDWNCPSGDCDDVVRPFSAFQQPNATRPDYVHTDVYYYDDVANDYFILSNDVDWYDVTPSHKGAGIMFYETGGWTFYFTNIGNPNYNWDPTGGGEYPYWWNKYRSVRSIYGQVGNPDISTGLLHALRNTADWSY